MDEVNAVSNERYMVGFASRFFLEFTYCLALSYIHAKGIGGKPVPKFRYF